MTNIVGSININMILEFEYAKMATYQNSDFRVGESIVIQ
jgi:hypothetical protein